MVAKQTGEVFAYFVRCNDYELPNEMELWVGSVFDTWTISDNEYETYAEAFGVAPIITMEDLGVIALVECYGEAGYEEIEFGGNRWAKLPGDGPWYFEAKRNDDGNRD